MAQQRGRRRGKTQGRPGRGPGRPKGRRPPSGEFTSLKSARRSALYLEENQERLRRLGKPFLVLYGEQVVGKGDSAAEAWDEASRSGAPEHACVLVELPMPDDEDQG